MIRQLSKGEPIPGGEPARYLNREGYVRLRWLVGPADYVEALEHRLVMGFPEGEIHHLNGDKTDNRPENLAVLSKVEHATLHGEQARATSRSATEWEGDRSQQAFDKRQRRLAREQERRELIARIVALRETGLTTVEIGLIVGRDASNITRALQQAEREAAA